MKTEILTIDADSLKKASEIINAGGLVAMPTETVYGLAADATNGEAVKKIFLVKGRPSDNPLIVHLSKVEDLSKATDSPTELAKLLLSHFSPGPITVVLHKNGLIPNEVSAGLDTVGIRIPSHVGARAFIEACGTPIAAPSANTSKRPSPTNALDVYADMEGKIPLILDGGACDVGIESTVVDCRGEVPIILRAGKITGEDIKKVAGCVDYAKADSKVRSPGMKYTHYAPLCEMYCRFGELSDLEDKLKELIGLGKKVALIGNKEVKDFPCNSFIYLGDTVEEYMQNYFSSLRKGEKLGDVIVCYVPFSESKAEGLYNRAKKSCGGKLL